MATERRWRRASIVVLVALLFAAGAALLTLRHYAQPEQTARLVRDFVKNTLQLTLDFDGAPAIDVWPRLSLDLQAPRLLTADAKPLLSARRLSLAMPWSSLRGESLSVDRLELDAPQLDLDALDAWITSSAASTTPDVRLGVSVRDGRVRRAAADIASGIALDGDLDLRALDAWWHGLGAATRADQLLPPGDAHLHIARLQLGDALLEGVDLRNMP